MRMRTGLLVVVAIGILFSKAMAEDTQLASVSSFPASQSALDVPESGMNVPSKASSQTALAVEKNFQSKRMRVMKLVSEPGPTSPTPTHSSKAFGVKAKRAVTDSKSVCCQPAHVNCCRHHCCRPIQCKTYRACRQQSCSRNSRHYQQDYQHLIYGYQLFYGYRKW